MSKAIDNRRVWGIRAGKGGEAHDEFVETQVIALADAGLGNLDRIDKSRDAFYAAYRQRHPSETRTGSAGVGGKFFRFVHEVQEGDLVLYPALKDRKVYVGQVTGRYTYVKSSVFPHQRTVKWKYVIPKDDFSQQARYELGAARTFFEVKKNTEELIKKIGSNSVEKFSHKPKSASKELKQSEVH